MPLKNSLLHSSIYRKQKIKNNQKSISEYERLEFLGDRVLGLSIAYLIYNNFPEYNEGKMSIKLSYLVKKNFLYKISYKLSLYKFIKISNDQKINLKNNKSIQADTLESLIGAIFLDGGFEKSLKFIKKIWSEYIVDEDLKINDPKTILQELSQGKSKLLPIYKLKEKIGPSHSPIFKVSVNCLNLKEVTGKGNSKREAEKDAARNFMIKYKLINEK